MTFKLGSRGETHFKLLIICKLMSEWFKYKNKQSLYLNVISQITPFSIHMHVYNPSKTPSFFSGEMVAVVASGRYEAFNRKAWAYDYKISMPSAPSPLLVFFWRKSDRGHLFISRASATHLLSLLIPAAFP